MLKKANTNKTFFLFQKRITFRDALAKLKELQETEAEALRLAKEEKNKITNYYKPVPKKPKIQQEKQPPQQEGQPPAHEKVEEMVRK
jgi:hypothetical protein